MFTYKWNLTDLEKVKPLNKTVFSLFAGAGGSSMGYKMAGYEVIGCNEIDPRQMALYKENLKPKYSFCEDIRTFKNRDDLPKELYELDILDASPPCSLFSSANLKADDKKGKEVKFREGQVSQVLDDLFFETIDVVEKLKPKVAVLENVSGLLHDKNKWYVEQIYKRLCDLGYKITHKLINCADCGVPQKRRRVFFLATRLDVDTIDLFGSEPKIDLGFNEEWVTLGDIEKDNKTKEPTHHVTSMMKDFKKGDKALGCIRSRIDGKNTGFQTYIVANSDVCPTIRTSNDFIQIDNNLKAFSKLELLQLGSFPLDYNFLKTIPVYSIGMSVPPLAAYRISTQIYKEWLK